MRERISDCVFGNGYHTSVLENPLGRTMSANMICNVAWNNNNKVLIVEDEAL